jgi:hypothetical protein
VLFKKIPAVVFEKVANARRKTRSARGKVSRIGIFLHFSSIVQGRNRRWQPERKLKI